MEVEDVDQAVQWGVLERAADPRVGALRPVDGEPWWDPVRVVAAGVGVGDQVDAVIGVQVGDVDGVDVEQADVALQLAERAGAEVDEEPEAVVGGAVGGSPPGGGGAN
jgi:hypothetical protein